MPGGAEQGPQEQGMKGQGGNRSLKRIENQDWIDSVYGQTTQHPGSGGHFAIYWGAKTQRGSGGVAPEFFLVATPFKLSENMSNALL